MGTKATVAVAGAKGGVGKTTSLNLAALMATSGETIVVEFDLAMANGVDFLSIDCDPDEDVTLHDVLAGTASVADASYPAPGGFDIVPSGTTLDGYVEADPDGLPGVVSALDGEYDFVIVDGGAGLSRETLLPLSVSDETIVVSTPRLAAVRDTRKTIELTRRVGGSVAGVAFARPGTGNAPEPSRIASFLEVELLGHVPEDPAVPASQDAGEPVVVYAPNSRSAEAYVEIARAITARRASRPAASRAAADGGESAGCP